MSKYKNVTVGHIAPDLKDSSKRVLCLQKDGQKLYFNLLGNVKNNPKWPSWKHYDVVDQKTNSVVGSVGDDKKFEDRLQLSIKLGEQTTYFKLMGKPSAELIEKVPSLAQMAEKWPSWKDYNVVLSVKQDD